MAALTACSTARLVTSTSPTVPSPPTEAVLTGQLANTTKGDSVWVWHVRPDRRVPTKVAVGPSGEFRLVLTDMTKPVDAQYAGPGGFITMFLSPGDSVHLTADRRDFWQTLRFAGRGSAANNYLALAHRRFDTNRDSIPETLYKNDPPTEFQRKVEARQRQQLDLLAAYAAQQPLPNDFVRLRQSVLQYQKAVSLLRYVHYLKSTTKQDPAVPADFLAPFTSLPLSSLDLWGVTPALLQATSDMFGIYPYVRLLPPSGVLPAEPGTAERIFAQATADFGDTPARDQIIGNMLTGQLFGPLVSDQRPVLAMLPIFWAHNRDSTAAQSVRRALRNTQALQTGSLAPDFSLQNANGKPVSLRDLRGKVIYVDFWYSSCAPCLAEAPAASALKKKFAGRDVVFLYISVDRKTEVWQKTMAKYALTSPNSIHLLDPEYKVAPKYGVGSYPTYRLIGRNGRILQGVAPRPSAGAETVAALEQALVGKP